MSETVILMRPGEVVAGKLTPQGKDAHRSITKKIARDFFRCSLILYPANNPLAKEIAGIVAETFKIERCQVDQMGPDHNLGQTQSMVLRSLRSGLNSVRMPEATNPMVLVISSMDDIVVAMQALVAHSSVVVPFGGAIVVESWNGQLLKRGNTTQPRYTVLTP